MCGLLAFLLTASAVFLYAINNFVYEEKMLKIMAEPELSSAKQNVRNKKDNQHAMTLQSNIQTWIKE
jgi:hypothetical protein